MIKDSFIVANELPMEVNISFQKIYAYYQEILSKQNAQKKNQVQMLINIFKKHSVLHEDFKSYQELNEHQEAIEELLHQLFPPALSNNEIKLVSIPFSSLNIYASDRFNTIMANSGIHYEDLVIRNFNDNSYYIMACCMILSMHYGHKIDFRRPFFLDIPDAQGNIKNYRMLINGDFMEIIPKENAPKITQKDINYLLNNPSNIKVWKEIFPPNSFIFKGFAIINLIDVSLDQTITAFKDQLILPKEETEVKDYLHIVERLFNIKNLRIGITRYTHEQKFERIIGKEVPSFILGEKENASCEASVCKGLYAALLEKKEIFTIPNVKQYEFELLKNNLLSENVQSIIFAPLIYDNQTLGYFELASSKPFELNGINAVKLNDLIPHLAAFAKESEEATKNQIEALIQKECTSIHPSVFWRFEQEGKRVLDSINRGVDASFKEMVFKDVYPLFAQIDIKGSSNARNKAIANDLTLQLAEVEFLLKKLNQKEPLPIFEQQIYFIQSLTKKVKEEFSTQTEQEIDNYLNKNIKPLFLHQSKVHPNFKNELLTCVNTLGKEEGKYHKNRTQYHKSVNLINHQLGAILEKEQIKAQKMYPHYFQMFKTDGVEHNIYIGKSITQHKPFDLIYLYNLRLWQIQIICQMERHFSILRKELGMPLEVASLILAFGNSLNIRYRMDEKHFDVDGAYNIRYEIIKKRIDKAHIKGTKERITQAGKLAVIYAQEKERKEYLRYFEFLQNKAIVGENLEQLEVEDLQGVSGLKALRINILYPNHEKEEQTRYTYNDLLKEIN